MARRKTGTRWQRAAILAGLGPILALAVAACGRQPAGGAAGGGTVTVRASEFTFEPSAIRVPVDKPVRLVLVNAGQLEHDLEIATVPAKDVRQTAGHQAHAARVAVHVAAGRQAWVEFTPTATGSYEFVCTISGHKEAGMRGTLVPE